MTDESKTAAVGQDHGGEVNQTRSEYSGRSPQSIVEELRSIDLWKVERDYLAALCVCGHPNERHGMPGPSAEPWPHPHECSECSCVWFEDAAEFEPPLTAIPLCLNCRTPMSPVADSPGTFECLFCQREGAR